MTATSGQLQPNARSAIGRNRDELEFLPAALEVLETPPRPAARLIALLICVFFVVALAWATFGYIDTVAVAQGQIVPSERVKLIQPLENGIIREIHVRDGQAVSAGDVLITLDPTDAQANVDAIRYDLLRAQLDAATGAALLEDDPERALQIPEGATGTLLEASLSQMRGDAEKLRASLLGIDSEIEEQRAILSDFQNQQEKARQTLPLIEDRLAGLEVLEEKQLARKTDLVAVRQQHIEVRSQITSASFSIEQANARIRARQQKRGEVIASMRADVLQKRGDALRRVAAFEQQLRKETRRNSDRALRAPIDGAVTGLSVFTVGGVATTKDVLMRIVPSGSSLVIEALVLNKDIGFVAKGQPVEIKLETFPFTRYGLVHGTVTEIWRDAMQDEKLGLVYKAEIELKEARILIGSEWVPLSPGMSVQAEIRTGDRRAIDYFLSPFLRYRDESLRER